MIEFCRRDSSDERFGGEVFELSHMICVHFYFEAFFLEFWISVSLSEFVSKISNYPNIWIQIRIVKLDIHNFRISGFKHLYDTM
ncbi:hypothetical protein HanRHA438_Chr13g0600361 [Helianthus annuus]|nr:hypothetical protein HanRHA438_Chr13g0600361 [Helianthus annuus]